MLTPGESPNIVIGRARGAMQKLALAHEQHKPVKLTPQQVSALVCVLRPQVHDTYKGFLGAPACVFDHPATAESQTNSRSRITAARDSGIFTPNGQNNRFTKRKTAL